MGETKKKRAAVITTARTAKSGRAVNLKNSPLAEYLHLSPDGKPSYMTFLILRMTVESLGGMK
jgi:hypothetical protein